ncbi:MAG: hypothetical protein JEZ03_00645 [Bacteroidales bacterium]|nr:hypothetical protein [Bacteroidales bacterium]
MRKQSIILSIFILLGMSLQAQYQVDALRYSRLDHGGTARSVSLGGAFGALGGDISTLSTNPAGIGLYRSSEVVFTPTFRFGSANSQYYGDKSTEYYANASIDNFGMVLALKPTGNSIMERIQIGFGINRIADFSNKIGPSTVNNVQSRANYYSSQAQGLDPVSLEDEFKLAWDTYLIDTIGTNNHYYSDLQNGVYQKNIYKTYGEIDEVVISGGANISDRLYLGVTFGFPKLEYHQENLFLESDRNEESEFFSDFKLSDEYSAVGRGINAKIGVIGRPLNWLRLGAAYHSPTVYSNIQEQWSTSMTTNFDQQVDGYTTYTSSLPNGSYNYKLVTPARYIGSAAFLIGKLGLLSIEYEHVDYTKARLEPFSENPLDDFSLDNETIESSYRSVGNIKAGAEVRLGAMSVRGGFAFYPSPYKEGVNDHAVTSYSAGLGYRGESFFADFAYVYSASEDSFYTSNPVLFEPSQNTYHKSQILMTFGLRF